MKGVRMTYSCTYEEMKFEEKKCARHNDTTVTTDEMLTRGTAVTAT